MAVRIALLRRACVGVVIGLAVTALVGATAPVRASPPPPIFIVNSPADFPAGGDLTNGICQTTADNNVCTLRAAIMKANHWLGGGAIIQLTALPPGGRYTLTRAPVVPDDETTGDLNVTADMSIYGGGAPSATVIDAGSLTPVDRVLSIASGVQLTLAFVTIEGGEYGSDGGGINNAGTLYLYDSVIKANKADQGSGIYNSGSLYVIGDSVISNVAASGGGGIFNASFLQLNYSQVSGNAASGGGGGIFSQGAVTVTTSTLSGNTAVAGGGLYNSCHAAAVLVNSTVSGNRVTVNGGGLYNYPCPSTTLSLYNATVADNVADSDLNGSGNGGGLYDGNVATLQNSLLADNLASDFDSERNVWFFTPDDCAGPLASLDYNLVAFLTADCAFTATVHDQTNTPADLGPLEANGGPTWTQALLPGSPAIDAGNPGGCTDNFGAVLTTDQRGYRRPAYGAHSFTCDIGAYERQQLAYLPFVRR